MSPNINVAKRVTNLNGSKVKWGSWRKTSGTNLTLKCTSMLDAENLWSVPGIAADTFQPVQIILVEDLRRTKQTNQTPLT